MPYDPRKPYLSGEQYVHNPTYLTAEVAECVARDVLTLNRALGYDINTVEFAIKDDVPYAIDFMNPAPDAELASVGEFYHNWLTKAVTDLVFRRLSETQIEPTYRWDALLNPPAATETATQTLAAAASAAQSATDSILPQAVRELPSNVVSTVSDIVGQATGVVSNLVETITESAAPEPAPKPKRTRSTSTKRSGTTTKRASTRSKKSASEKPTTEG
jgi:hypothetical protein